MMYHLFGHLMRVPRSDAVHDSAKADEAFKAP